MEKLKKILKSKKYKSTKYGKKPCKAEKATSADFWKNKRKVHKKQWRNLTDRRGAAPRLRKIRRAKFRKTRKKEQGLPSEGKTLALLVIRQQKAAFLQLELAAVYFTGHLGQLFPGGSRGQVVISGETESVSEACAKAKEAGAKRALPLAVSGAFHSPLMEPARIELGEAIEKTVIKKPICPVYQNVSGLPVEDPELIKTNLLAQLTSPVRWTQSVKNMLADEADYFMEIGPGKVLQGLVKRIGGPIVEVEGIETL